MKKITLILFSFFIIYISYSQSSTYAFHIYNPIGMFQKAGGKFEFRTNNMGFLIVGIQYYGPLPKYPGTQDGLEWRIYSKADSIKKNETFLYSKIIAGHQLYVEQSGDGFTNQPEVPEGYYYGLGAGIGRHFNFGQFFIDANAGLKYAFSDVSQNEAFYITGPASYMDLHCNLGFQF